MSALGKVSRRKKPLPSIATRRTIAVLRLLNLRKTCADIESNAALSPDEMKTAIFRLNLLVKAAKSISRGDTFAGFSKAHKVSVSTLHRWFQAFSAHGAAGLVHRYGRCGRKRKLVFTESEAARFKELYLGTCKRRVVLEGNASAAMRMFALEHPGMRASLSQRKRPYCKPQAVRDAIQQLEKDAV